MLSVTPLRKREREREGGEGDESERGRGDESERGKGDESERGKEL